MLDFIKNISPLEVVVIALILVVFFGSKTVTNLGRLSGETFKQLKNIKKTFTDAIEEKGDEEKKSS